jgi:hypothetical protein
MTDPQYAFAVQPVNAIKEFPFASTRRFFTEGCWLQKATFLISGAKDD